MHIVHVATEFATVAKVGGLGDVTYGLSLELVRLGHQVTVILPKFDLTDFREISDFHLEKYNYTSFFENQWYLNTVWTGNISGVQLLFIDSHHPHLFYNRGMIYGSDDDLNRFLFYSRSVMDLLIKRDIHPDVIHVHDWHSSALLPLYKELCPQGDAKLVLTIHNLEYQGRCSPFDLPKIGLPIDRYNTPKQLQDPIYPEAANLLKGGIVNADAVTTVSPNYMKEIISPEGGKGLEAVIRQHQNKFSGILNGLDLDYWNPETDRYLPLHYSAKKPKNKELIKKTLQKRCGMQQKNIPLIGVVTRLVPQKGIDLIKDALDYTLKNGGQFILLGSSPVPSIQNDFEQLKQKYNGNSDVFLQLEHDEEIAHLIYAASDIFLMPSLFEPCGLTQLIALRYGTIPLVRNTGGLKDTIFDQINGFTFEDPTTESLHRAIDRTLICWRSDPFKWKLMMQKGMSTPFHWKNSAKQYIQVYKTKIHVDTKAVTC